MKIPMTPPNYEMLSQDEQTQVLAVLIAENLKSQKSHENLELTTIGSVNDKGKYLHWDKFRHLKPLPDGVPTATAWWIATKLVRKASYKKMPFMDKDGKPFVFATPDSVLQKLRYIDRNTGNAISNHTFPLNSNMRDTYLIKSLAEEAITSSQLEGASTTMGVAKEMLRTQRKPRDSSEQMIFNNYQVMEFIRDIKNETLTPKIVLELQRIITQDTLDDSNATGSLRTSADVIQVVDHRDNQILHTPPKAEELMARLKKLCSFANAKEDEHPFFIHPIVKAIVLHFMLAYDHPFVDGNGRTARALFYWSMAQQGYWFMEFISISQILKKQPGQYARAFLYTETDENDLTYFICHQLDIIVQAIHTLYSYLEKQIDEINQAEKLLYSNPVLRNKFNYRQVAIIKHALKHPHAHYQISPHRQSHHISYDTARNDLLELAKLGLLSQQKIGKAFVFIVSANLKKQIEDI